MENIEIFIRELLPTISRKKNPSKKWVHASCIDVGVEAKHPILKLVVSFYHTSNFCQHEKMCIWNFTQTEIGGGGCERTTLYVQIVYVRGMRCVRMHGMYCHFCCIKSVRTFHFVCIKYIRCIILWETTPKWNCLYSLKIA